MKHVYTKYPRIVDTALPYCASRRVVVQAGAHVGVWPKRLAEKFELVVALEPKLDSWQAAVDATKTANNVLLINGALGARIGAAKISGGEFSGSAKISAEQGETTPMYTIDSLPLAIRSRVDAVFLDVEGYELEIIRGAVGTITSQLPLLVLEFENNAWSLEDLLALLPSSYESLGVFHRDIILRAAQ